MKKFLLFFLLLPTILHAQTNIWYSAGGIVYIDRTFDYTGYGGELSANAELLNGFSLGLGVGVSKIPILTKAYLPVTAKATFFPGLNDSRLAPFATAELGYAIYNDNKSQKGNVLAYGGIGFSYDSQAGSPFISLGYGVYGYTLASNEAVTQRRATLKFGWVFNKRRNEF